MNVNWRAFVDELIQDFQNGKTSWGKVELVSFIKDKMIDFLSRYAE